MNGQLPFRDGAPLHSSRYLPGRPLQGLVGRQADLDALHAALKTNAAVLLHGQPGVGRTALANALAASHIEHPGGVLWLDGRDETSLALANRVARAYGAAPASPGPDRAGGFAQARSLLEAQRPLIVLDGQVRLDAAREFVDVCAPGLPLVIAARHPLAGPWAPFEVAGLEREAGRALLLRLAAGAWDAGDDAAEHLADALDGNALSLTVAGLQLAAGIGLEALLTQMPDLPPGPANRVMAMLMAAYRLLPQDLQGMVMLIGTAFAGEASDELLSDVTGAPTDGICARMRQLVERGFVAERMGADRPTFSAHEMVQRFAQAFLRGKRRLDTMRARHLHGLLVYVRRHSDEASATQHERLAAEMPNIIAAGRHAALHHKADFLQELTQMLAPAGEESFVRACGFLAEYEWLRHLQGTPEAAEAGVLGGIVPEPDSPAPDSEPGDEAVSEDAQATVEAPLAEPDAEAGPVAEAGAAEAVSEAADLPVPETMPEEAAVAAEPAAAMPDEEPAGDLELPSDTETLERLAREVKERGDPHETINRYAQAADSFKADGNVDDELAAIEALAMLSLEGERYEDVLAYVDQGVRLAQEADNPRREGELLVVLGDLQVTLERWEGAESAYKEAVEAFRPSEAWLDVGVALDKLGSVYWEMGRLQDAVMVWEQAVVLFERVERDDLLRDTLHKIADTRAESLEWDSARAGYERLLALARARGDQAAEHGQFMSLGALFEAQGDPAHALMNYRRALHVAFDLAQREPLGAALLALARLLTDDTVQLNRTLQLLEAAEAVLPDDSEIKRLLGRAKTRQERLMRGGVALPVVSNSLQDYAREAYESSAG
ncbi:MAG: AAA family ATPase [Anaerolineae bacterium]|nr:AAA family ATPase [Anaerolineae bacterium]